MRRLTAVVLAVVALMACGGDGGGEEAAPDCPVERTLVADTTGLVLGAKVEPVAIGTDVQCTFTASDGITSVALTTWRDPGSTMGLLAEDLEAEPLDLPFAEDAWWAATTETLHAASADRGVTVQVIDVTGLIEDPRDVAVRLAAAALA